MPTAELGLSERVATEPSLLEEKALLFFCGMGIRICWFAVNCAIDYFTDVFGAAIYPEMLFVYNVAALLALLFQLKADERCDRHYGVRVTYQARFYLGAAYLFGALLLLPALEGEARRSCGMPVLQAHPHHVDATFADPTLAGRLALLAAIFVVGASDYIASGTCVPIVHCQLTPQCLLYQVSAERKLMLHCDSRLSQIAGAWGHSPVSLYLGQSSCGVILFVYTRLTGFGNECDTHDLHAKQHGSTAVGGTDLYFGTCSVLTIFGVLCHWRFWKSAAASRVGMASARPL